jgi:signal transduction histidine kinase
MTSKNKKTNNKIRIKNRFRGLKETILNLEKTNDDLKKLSDLKDEFISLATHQIRGPLGAMKGYLSLILEGDYGQVPKELLDPVKIVFKSADSLSKTVNDFLDISRIEQGQMKLFFKDFNLVDLVHEAVGEMKNVIKTKGLDLQVKIQDKILMVHGDKTKLKQVIINLIDNSYKYTEAGWMEICLEKCESDKVLFRVKDSGVGIKEKTLPLLFQKFSRCSGANDVNILGTGLGLYIAKKMVEANHGKIWAESAGEGKGAEFYVELNLVK